MKQVFNWLVLAGAAAAAIALVLAGLFVGGAAQMVLIVAGIVGVPLVLLGMLAMHYLNVVQRSGDLTQMQRRHVEGGVQRLEATLSEAVRLATESNVPAAEIERLVQEVNAQLQSVGVVSVAGTEATIKMPEHLPGGNWVRRAEVGIQTALVASGNRVAPLLDERARAIPGGGEFACPRGVTLTAVCRAYQGQLKGSGGAVQARIDTVEKAIADVEAEANVDEAWEHWNSAKRLWASGQTDLALRALDDAEKIVTEHLRPNFESRRGALVGTIERVRELEVAAAAGAHVAETLARLSKEASAMEGRMGAIAAIEELESRFAAIVNDLTKEARAKAARVREALANHPGLSDPEGVAEVVRALNDLPEVGIPYEAAIEAWLDIATHQLPRLARFSTDLDLARVMERMNRIIEQKLKEKGSVAVGDLRVRERGEQILDLYARSHPETKLENGVLKLAEKEAKKEATEVG